MVNPSSNFLIAYLHSANVQPFPKTRQLQKLQRWPNNSYLSHSALFGSALQSRFCEFSLIALQKRHLFRLSVTTLFDYGRLSYSNGTLFSKGPANETYLHLVNHATRRCTLYQSANMHSILSPGNTLLDKGLQKKRPVPKSLLYCSHFPLVPAVVALLCYNGIARSLLPHSCPNTASSTLSAVDLYIHVRTNAHASVLQ